MSQKEKLVARFLSKPKDFTYSELKQMLQYFGYTCDESGNGSRVRFYNPTTKDIIKLHKPHPGNIVHAYVLEEVLQKLKESELL